MEENKDMSVSHGVEYTQDGSSRPESKEENSAVTLVPHPSSDPRDPLNWAFAKKMRILAVISFATFAGFSACLAGQLQPGPQSLLYKVTTTQMAYQNSASSAGMAAGGFFFYPLSHVLGRSSAIFWSLIGTLASQIWASQTQHRDDYTSFIVSRFFGGFFGSVVGVLGPRVLVDMFFLHQRGRAFTVFHWCFDFGTVAGPTISALIDANTSWIYAYVWTSGLVGVALILVFAFMHETTWDRKPNATNVEAPQGFLSNRIATFLPGNRVTLHTPFSDTLRISALPFKIALQPVTLIIAVYSLVNFGFYVAMNSLSPVFLQKPVAAGGYGFNTMSNALFSFGHWIGIIFALFYGQFISDRLPLWLAARNGGIWKPEYRLHALWLPAIINPIGLLIWGLALQNHWSWVILALAQVFVTFGSLALTPVTVNYMCECFIDKPAETSIAVNAYRVCFGLSVAFYINPWVAAVKGVAWTYGMMAIFEVFSFMFVILLMWKGHQIRNLTFFKGLSASEEGEHVVQEKNHETQAIAA